MKKLDEFKKNLKTAIEAQKLGIQNEIKNLQSQVDSKSSDLEETWKMLGGAILIWVVGVAVGIACSPAENIITVLLVLLCALITWVGGAVLVVVAILVIVESMYKGVIISSLKSEISSKEETIRKLDKDIKKLR